MFLEELVAKIVAISRMNQNDEELEQQIKKLIQEYFEAR